MKMRDRLNLRRDVKILDLTSRVIGLERQAREDHLLLVKCRNAIDATQRALGTLDAPGPLADRIVSRATEWVPVNERHNRPEPEPYDQDTADGRTPIA